MKMNILKKLTIKSLKMNKKRTIGTIIGIFLSTALICAVTSMGVSFQKSLVKNSIRKNGYYHLNINSVSASDVEKLSHNRDISKITKVYVLGNAQLGDSFKTSVYSLNDDTSLEDRAYYLTSGRAPKDKNEIVINQVLEHEFGYKIGDEVDLNIGDITSDEEGNVIISNGHQYHYTIVGIIGNNDHDGFQGIIFTRGQLTDKIDLYLAFKNPHDYQRIILDILGEKDYGKVRQWQYESKNFGPNYNVNDDLLRYEVLAFDAGFANALVTVVSIVLVIILVASVFCIRNSFAIATTEKMKMYGMLSSIGATRKQIRKSVLYEEFILGVIAIPLGIVCGLLASYLLVVITNWILSDNVFANGQKIYFFVSYISVIVSIVLGFVTIYLSALASAIKASHMSLIKQIRNSGEIKIKRKKLKVPKLISKIFKTGGNIAYKNLKRSKKKYRTTVVSLTVSIFVFIALNTFITEAFFVTDESYIAYDYKIQVILNEEQSSKYLDDIIHLDGVSKHFIDYTTGDNSLIFMSDLSKAKDLTKYYTHCPEEDESSCRKYFIILLSIYDHETFKEYVKKAHLRYDDVKGKAILNDDYYYEPDDSDKRIYTRLFNYEKGDTIIGSYSDEEDVPARFEIGAVTDVNPYGKEENYTDARLIVDAQDFPELALYPRIIYLEADDADAVVAKIAAMDPTIIASNLNKYVEETRALAIVISIFLYGFITVITLIGVTNIFNTITSNMELRQKEFAMLKSIGMTKKEFNRMINLETLFYSMKSLVYGIVIGVILSYLIHKAVDDAMEIAYHLPLTAIFIVIIFVFLLVFIIMHYSLSKINRQNTIETIRNDNI